MLNEYTDRIASATAICTYIVSGSVTLVDILDLMDDHAASFGVMIAFMTFVTNWFFQWRRLRITINKRRADGV